MVVVSKQLRGVNDHHLYFPEHKYLCPPRKTGITPELAMAFRNLPCNVVEWPVHEHDAYHNADPKPKPPPMPSWEEMATAVAVHLVRGCPECHRATEKPEVDLSQLPKEFQMIGRKRRKRPSRLQTHQRKARLSFVG